MIRVKSHSDFDALTTFYAQGSSELRQGFNKNLSVIKGVEQIGVNFAVAYLQTHKLMTLSPRDIYINFFYNVEPSGKITLVTFDETDVEYPEEEGYVRMKAPIGGFVFIPDKDDPTRCSV